MGDLHPVLGLLAALLEEAHERRRHLLAVVGIDVEPGLAVDDDLRRAAVEGGEGGEAAGHCLHHRQPERFVERRLDERALGVGDHAVELAVPHAVHLRRDPPELAVELVGLDQVVHLLHLRLLLQILRFLPPVAADDHEVGQFPQFRAFRVELDQSGQVLHPIQPRHGEDDRLRLVLNHAEMLVVLDLAEEKLLDLRVEGGEPPLRLRVGEVDVGVCTWGNDVEFGVENVDSVDYSVQSRHRERRVRFVLPHCILTDEHQHEFVVNLG